MTIRPDLDTHHWIFSTIFYRQLLRTGTQQCIKTTFQDLRDQTDFMDVTLCCEGEQVRAHKVILSACSVTFRHLLKVNPAPNPVILLWVSRFFAATNWISK
jgi:hypothetical protein